MKRCRLTAIFVVAAIGGTVAVGCGDDPDQIDDGVEVAGIDVGGMRSPEAKGAIRVGLEHSTQRRLTAFTSKQDGDQRIALPRPKPPLKFDVDTLVKKALRAGPDERIATRDDVSGVHASIGPLVQRVREAVDTPARDARIAAGGGGVSELTSRRGVSVLGERLEAAVLALLARPRSGDEVEVPVKITEPEVTTRELAKEYPQLVSIDRATFTLRLYDHLKLAQKYTIAVGASGYDTPAGRYEIESKQVDPVWSVPNSDWTGDLAGAVIPPGPSNPLKARWMGFAGAAGIHGTDDAASLGTAASHGCIRMAVPDVVDLYERVSVGTPVYVS